MVQIGPKTTVLGFSLCYSAVSSTTDQSIIVPDIKAGKDHRSWGSKTVNLQQVSLLGDNSWVKLPCSQLSPANPCQSHSMINTVLAPSGSYFLGRRTNKLTKQLLWNTSWLTDTIRYPDLYWLGKSEHHVTIIYISKHSFH